MRIIIFTSLLALVISSPVLAKPYFGVRGGIAEVNLKENFCDSTESETLGVVGGFIGYKVGVVRMEAEYTYRDAGDYARGTMEHSSQSVMGNMYFEPLSKSSFRPYVGGGIGQTFHRFRPETGSSETDNSLTWSLGAGMGIEVSRKVFLELGYRYLNLGESKLVNVDYDAQANEGYLGLRFEL